MTIQEALKEIGLTGKSLAKKLGMSYGWYRRGSTRKGEPLFWVKAFVIGYKLGKENKDCGCHFEKMPDGREIMTNVCDKHKDLLP